MTTTGRMNKHWTKEELERFNDEAILAADTNAVLNFDELAETFGRTVSSVKHVANKLRREGKMSKYDRNNQQDKYRSFYSENEKKMIASLVADHYSFEEIARITGRTKFSIAHFWRKHGHPLARSWSSEEESLLLDIIKFDRYGVVTNYKELQEILNRKYDSIRVEVYKLRKRGKLQRAERNGMPEEKREEFKRYVHRFFVKSV